MTDHAKRAEELRAMVKAATPGPWVADVMPNVWGQAIGSRGKIANLHDLKQAEGYDPIPHSERPANACLIASAPTLATELADLHDEVARLREAMKRDAIDRLNRLIDWLDADPDNGTLLIASLSDEQIRHVRTVLGARK